VENRNLSEALMRFRSGSNCAQSVLSVYFGVLGFDESLGYRMGAGLGGGVGRKQYLCGAVNAGAIILSARFGNADRSNAAQKESTVQCVREFVNEFEKEFNTSQCRQILGADISSPDGRKKTAEAGLFDTLCVECITKVCTLLECNLGAATHSEA
jgi:C_GCAxxG_C_C family probable redox protein